MREQVKVGDRVHLAITDPDNGHTKNVNGTLFYKSLTTLYFYLDKEFQSSDGHSWRASESGCQFDQELSALGLSATEPNCWSLDGNTEIIAILDEGKTPPKKYDAECPCGIIPSMCDYHKD